MTALDRRWERVRRATRDSGDRFVSLVRHAGPAGSAMATREWTVADSAAHVLSIASWYTTVFDPAAPGPPVDGLAALLARTNVDTVRRTNAVVLDQLPQRDPERLADALHDAVHRLLAATVAADPERPVPWLGGSRVPVIGVLAHLVNEFLVHGWDMAGALRRPWPMPDHEAATFLEEFLVGMIRHDYGVLLDHGGRPPKRTIGVEFRSSYTAPVGLVLRDGRVHVSGAGDPADVRVTFRPSRLNLMLFGRLSAARAMVRRDVVVGGPRPWLLPSFLRFVHMPRN
ncbi:maleylpyruvate isomerase family mycothiol-dependent enzyme [Actinoplanes sp. NPDC049802]|uniref:maleylpyruvate isomerase family mycothiol-dependent enzyme n=1 Tax=Actinoplanes sp. NPDC049802 TaxID=3154742 RepID=UPI003406BEA3